MLGSGSSKSRAASCSLLVFERFCPETSPDAWSEIYIFQDRRLDELPLECKLRRFDLVT